MSGIQRRQPRTQWTSALRLSSLLLMAALPASATSPPLLSSSTEQRSPEERPASRALAKAVLDSAGPRYLEDLRQCMEENSVEKGAYERLFSATALPPLEDGERVYFVRPTHDPFCLTFYGAHTFQFWLVGVKTTGGAESYTIQYAGEVDTVRVLSTRRHGRYDFIETTSTGRETRDATMRFDGKRYVAVHCTRTSFVEEDQREKVVRCQQSVKK